VIAQTVLNHRGPEFRAILTRTQDLLKPIFGTANPVLLLASSGTGAMEASLANVLAPGERVLVSVSGQFGERFAAIAKALGADVDILETPWGQAVDPAAIQKRAATGEYRAVVVTHNESSTAVVADLAAIGRVLRDLPTLFIVDSVSGLAGLELRQDDWGIDIVVSASQKALMCPPGVGLISASPKAWEVIHREDRIPRFYWDLRKAIASAEKVETPFTPAVPLIAGLCEALEMIHEEGWPNVIGRHCRIASALRAGCAELGLSSFGQPNALSSTVVALNVPENLNGSDIVRCMYEQHGTVIAGSRNKLSGRVIRIGTMGDVHAADVFTDLLHLEATLSALGMPVQPGAALAAAAAHL
jgi:aspartate aminotransferase-like enzyme